MTQRRKRSKHAVRGWICVTRNLDIRSGSKIEVTKHCAALRCWSHWLRVVTERQDGSRGGDCCVCGPPRRLAPARWWRGRAAASCRRRPVRSARRRGGRGAQARRLAATALHRRGEEALARRLRLERARDGRTVTGNTQKFGSGSITHRSDGSTSRTQPFGGGTLRTDQPGRNAGGRK